MNKNRIPRQMKNYRYNGKDPWEDIDEILGPILTRMKIIVIVIIIIIIIHL